MTNERQQIWHEHLFDSSWTFERHPDDPDRVLATVAPPWRYLEVELPPVDVPVSLNQNDWAEVCSILTEEHRQRVRERFAAVDRNRAQLE
jgi:hypothetical protein